MGSGFRVQGLGFRVQDLGFRVQRLGFMVQGLSVRVANQTPWRTQAECSTVPFWRAVKSVEFIGRDQPL